MQVVILCGGMGTRLREETEYKPKPMIEIGSKPILWHIMKIYAHFGYTDFILCLGYKADIIKNYFLNYRYMDNNAKINLKTGNVQIFKTNDEEDWNITLVNTGINAMTGARIKKIEKFITEDSFMMTYGDGVANINISNLVDFHKKHEKIGTVTGVRPASRFGALSLERDHVINFSEKPQITEGFINGGFFVFNRCFFNYLSDSDDCILEKEPLENLTKDGELMVYKHKDFWQCMDTYRDMQLLNNLWYSRELEKELHFTSFQNGKPPWKIWNG